MLSTIHEPTRSWHNISRSKCSIIAQNNTQTNQGQQHFRLAQPTRRQAKSVHTAWRYLPTARRQRPPSATVFQSPLGGAQLTARRHAVREPLQLFLSPSGISKSPDATLEVPHCWFWNTHWFVPKLEHYHKHHSSHSSGHYAKLPSHTSINLITYDPYS